MVDRAFNRHGEMPQGFLPYSCRDIAGSLGELFLEQAGVRRADNPVASHLAHEGVDLAKLARHWLAPHYGVDELRGAPTPVILGRALGVDDFVSALTSGWHDVVRATFNEAISGYRSLLREIPVKNFLPQHIPTFNGISALVEMPEFGEWGYGSLTASSVLEDTQVTTYGLQFTVSRQSLVNDQVREITAMMAELANIAALHVAASVASALEGTLAGGGDYFHADYSNLLTGGSAGAPSVTTFDAAAALLWRMPVGSHIAGTAPRYIVGPPEMHGTARVLAAAIYDPNGSPGSLPQGRFDVVVLPHLASTTYWYLMGDPQTAPALALLHLEGSSELAMLEQIPTPPQKDGLTFRLRTDYKVARISRTGAVKIAP